MRQRALRWYYAIQVRWLRGIRILGAVAAVLLGLAAANWLFQLARKPSEVFFPFDGALAKTPVQTWGQYGALFNEHSTTLMTPALLAALAQAEGAGNPVARTYWRWRVSWNPVEVYRPASSAVGMYQITDARFAEAKRYCIHGHVSIDDGPWHEPRSCWFNALYTRTIATHSIEMTAAYLDVAVTRALVRNRIEKATLAQRQTLAALIHLCGAGAGERYARRGLKMAPGQRCGDHDARAYVGRVEHMQRIFERIAAED